MSSELQPNPSISNEAQFREEVRRLLPDLYRAARALTTQPSDAEDLVHDACVKALRGYSSATLPDRASCRAWLRRILVNTFRDRYRRERRAPVSLADDSPRAAGNNVIDFAVSPEPSPENWARFTQMEAAVRAAMAALPADVRLVATLYLVNGVPYKEIADIAECPFGTVMSRLSRARRVLREALGPFIEPPAAGDRRKNCRKTSAEERGQ